MNSTHDKPKRSPERPHKMEICTPMMAGRRMKDNAIKGQKENRL